MVDLGALPEIEGFALIKVKIECPSLATFEFAGPTAKTSELQVWTFAFFDVGIDEIDVHYGQSFSVARSVSVTPIRLGEWNFAVDLALEEGSISLRSREIFFFSRMATEHPGN